MEKDAFKMYQQNVMNALNEYMLANAQLRAKLARAQSEIKGLQGEIARSAKVSSIKKEHK